MTGSELIRFLRAERNAGAARPPLGAFINSTDATAIELAAMAGFDLVIIDSEHAPIDRTIALGHIRTAAGAGVKPLVRILDSADTTVQSFLDLGAAGVIIPKVETAADAVRAVRACRYPPAGTRGMCHACRDGQFKLEGFSARMTRRNADVLAIPLIETRRAMDNIAEIARVDGIGILFFGPGDLSADMGIDLVTQREAIQDMWVRFRDACHREGKLTLCPGGLGFEGSDVYSAGVDLLMLFDVMANTVRGYDMAEAAPAATTAAEGADR
jgi:4-hydroxy-2-oxoheptanedioate aldolase